MQKLFDTYKDKAKIYIIYIMEAHPSDGWTMKANEKEGIQVKQPKDYEDRVKVAGECIKDLKLTIPMLVDDMENTAQKAYGGWPDRLYVVAKDGKIAYRGGLGPMGFKVAEAEAALKKELEKAAK